VNVPVPVLQRDVCFVPPTRAHAAHLTNFRDFHSRQEYDPYSRCALRYPSYKREKQQKSTSRPGKMMTMEARSP
jgi:hypothetical protein